MQNEVSPKTLIIAGGVLILVLLVLAWKFVFAPKPGPAPNDPGIAPGPAALSGPLAIPIPPAKR